MGAAENEANLAQALEAWNSGDLAGYLELYDDSIRLHGYGPEPLDKQTATSFYEGIFETFDMPKLLIHEVFSKGDSLCINFTMTGTHRGEFMGVPATGKPIVLPGITVLHFRDGKCVERWSSADFVGLLGQLGAFPPSTAAE